MNPFDLRGPQFLVFYIVLEAAGIFLLMFLRKLSGSGPLPRLPYDDPYRLAYLRGGANEALRVVMLSLLDRKLLAEDGANFVCPDPSKAALVKRKIEQEVCRHFEVPQKPESVFSGVRTRSIDAEYESGLAELGLLPNESQKLSQMISKLAVGGVILAVGFIKLVVAASRGKHNVGFLIILMLLYLIFLLAYRHRRTALGDRFLADLKVLFQGLKARSESIHRGGETAEYAMLLGIFGLSAAPYMYQSTIKKHFKKASNSGGGSSCGSSCSSSCGSSCGSGCGGGCGGCGG